MTLLHFNSNYMHLLKQKGLQMQSAAPAENAPSDDDGEADSSGLALQRMRDILRKIETPAPSRKKSRYRTQ